MLPSEVILFGSGGMACGVTSFLVSSFFKKPPEFERRIYYALISGIGAMAICWLGYRYFPERFEPWDAIPYGVMIGLFGIGRVLDWIAKRYGIDKVEKKNEQ
ncbi:hypothetical protein [uncultured Succinivibrio sp.]|uniref:hypothetical protein n=1 Tax=uncultured Succinivibrio sp. TaxID=540749 RepID=UPI0025EC2969|nr:hypothetical protein [uncultured Succinivibrio sp.]